MSLYNLFRSWLIALVPIGIFTFTSAFAGAQMMEGSQGMNCPMCGPGMMIFNVYFGGCCHCGVDWSRDLFGSA